LVREERERGEGEMGRVMELSGLWVWGVAGLEMLSQLVSVRGLIGPNSVG